MPTQKRATLTRPSSPPRATALYLALFLLIHSVQFDLVLGPSQEIPFPSARHDELLTTRYPDKTIPLSKPAHEGGLPSPAGDTIRSSIDDPARYYIFFSLLSQFIDRR